MTSIARAHTADAGPLVLRPLFDLRYLVDQEDALSLSFGRRLHDPCAVGVFFEVLGEHVVIGGHHVSDTFEKRMRRRISQTISRKVSSTDSSFKYIAEGKKSG